MGLKYKGLYLVLGGYVDPLYSYTKVLFTVVEALCLLVNVALCVRDKKQKGKNKKGGAGMLSFNMEDDEEEESSEEERGMPCWQTLPLVYCQLSCNYDCTCLVTHTVYNSDTFKCEHF